MKKSTFVIDGIDAIFEGYTLDIYCKGKACPLFTKEMADEIMRLHNENCGETNRIEFSELQDAYIEWGLRVGYKGVDKDGLHLYPIGISYWGWQDIADSRTIQSEQLLFYLQHDHYYLNCEQLYDVFFGTYACIDKSMDNKQIMACADGFVAAYMRGL